MIEAHYLFGADYDDIDMMEAQFVPLPAGDPSSDDGNATGTTKTDAEVLYDMMKSMDDMMTKQVGELSGGWRMRMALAKITGMM